MVKVGGKSDSAERCLVSCLLNVPTSESDRRGIEYAARDAQHTEDIPLVYPS